ncbi:MAG: hypothetical protein JNL90_15485 [Planctomycetes bacterium]|nr:hypothetical protein [Planctomycetota bacterium]
MVEASKSFVNVFVDCDWGRKNTKLTRKYGVLGYPTVLFTDSKGVLIERLGKRDPASVRAQMEKVAKAAMRSFHATFEAAAAEAAKSDKLVLFLFATKGRDSAELEVALFDDSLAEAMKGFVLARVVIAEDNAEAKRFAVGSMEQPVVFVLDPAAEKPEAKPLKKIVGKKTAKELLKEFQSIERPEKVEKGG